MHENQQAEIFQAMTMAVSPEKKEGSVKDDRYNPAKDPLTVISVFSLGYNDRKIANGQNLSLVDEFDMGLLV